jgi:hypothetical protein
VSTRAEHDAPYWCEENVWHLCADPRVRAGAAEVAIVTNADRKVALFHQRASPRSDGLVVWDYHVLLFAQDQSQDRFWRAWDLDSTLGWPVRALDYLERTFPPSLDPTLAPRFRVLAAADYRLRFGSDRRHMRSPGGGWLESPPPWPAIGATHELPHLLDTDDCTSAPWLDIDALIARYR